MPPLCYHANTAPLCSPCTQLPCGRTTELRKMEFHLNYDNRFSMTNIYTYKDGETPKKRARECPSQQLPNAPSRATTARCRTVARVLPPACLPCCTVYAVHVFIIITCPPTSVRARP